MKANEGLGIGELRVLQRSQQILDGRRAAAAVAELACFQFRQSGRQGLVHYGSVCGIGRAGDGISAGGAFSSSLAAAFCGGSPMSATCPDLTAPQTTNRLVTSTTVNAMAGRNSNTAPRASTISSASTAVTSPRGSIKNSNSVCL